MKKLKVVLSVVLALVLALSLASGCVSGTDTSGYELVSIAVDTANAKTEFDVGEEFTSDGIVVTATRRNVNDDTTDTVDVTADAVVDSDSYRPYVGEYEINISYTLGNITKSATYTVSVKYTVVTTLVRLELEESSVKTSFFVGEEFSAEGLTGVVRLRDTAGSSITARTEEVTLEDLVVDSSEYKKDTVGVYTIKVSYTAYEKTVEDTYTVTVEQQVRLSEITLGIAESAKYYSLGEEFSTDGLTVTATIYDFLNEKVEDVHEVALTDPNLEIDSSAFNNQQEGDYKINVSYTENGVTVEQSYTVYVRMGAGLYLEINGNPDSASYVLAKGGTTVDLSQIDVFIADVQGKTDVQLTEGYTMQVFRGSAENEYPVSENTFVADKAGAYNVWVRYEKYNIPNTDIVVDLDDFIIIYVTDELQSIELNEGAVLTQEAGPDEISKTWTFTATYSSGNTKQLTMEDVEVEGLNTRTPTENGVAVITYSEVDAIGASMTKSINVNYVIKQKGLVPGTTNNYSFNISELEEKLFGEGEPADKTKLPADAFETDSNSFLTFLFDDSGSDQYRTSGKKCIEIKGAKLSVTFAGTGTLTLTVASTGSSNNSRFGLLDADGQYVAASEYGVAVPVTEGAEAGTYEVTGTDYVTLVFDVTEAGVYTITSPSETTTRGGRIQTISMVDTVGGGTAVTENYSFNISELEEKLFGEGEPADKTKLPADAFETDSNSFLTFLFDDSGSDQYRTSGKKCIEIKGAKLSVTFAGTGTLTLTVASTGSSNNSRFGLLDANGQYVAASEYGVAVPVTEGAEAGTYEVTGTDYVTLVFDVTEAGVYTITSPSETTTRGGRIQTILMVDVY